ncbi:alpha/beta fold hydrolase [Kribbella sp. NPDC055071]
MTASYKDAPTITVDVNGVPFAYRQVGDEGGVPVVFLHHLTAVLDDWDPAVIDGVAAERHVIAFDNRGVGRSGGATPDNVEAMAEDAVAFIEALGLRTVDLVGFSLGGMVAQVVAQKRPDLVRRLVLAGTAPAGGKGGANAGPLLQSAIQQASDRGKHPKHILFFSPTPTSQAAADAFLSRARRAHPGGPRYAGDERVDRRPDHRARQVGAGHLTGRTGDRDAACPGRQRRRGHHAADHQFLRVGTAAP